MTPDRRHLIDDVLPVGRRQRLGMCECHALVVVRIEHVELRELRAAQERDVLAHILHAGVAGVVEGDLPRPAPLGRHQDDAVRAARSIDRRRRCILQNVHGFDIAGIDLVQVGADDAVHHYKWLVARLQGVAAAHTDAYRIRARCRVGRLDLHAGHEPRDGLIDPGHGDLRDILAGHRADRARQVLPELRAVAHHHHLVQRDRRTRQREVGARLFSPDDRDRLLPRRIPDPRRAELVGPRRHSRNHVAAVRSGHRAEVGPDRHEADPFQRHSRFSPHRALDLARGGLGVRRRRGQRRNADQKGDRRSHGGLLRRGAGRGGARCGMAVARHERPGATPVSNTCCVSSTAQESTPRHPGRKFATGSS